MSNVALFRADRVAEGGGTVLVMLASMKTTLTIMLVCFGSTAIGCHTARGVRDDTGAAVHKTGEKLEKAGDKIEEKRK